MADEKDIFADIESAISNGGELPDDPSTDDASNAIPKEEPQDIDTDAANKISDDVLKIMGGDDTEEADEKPKGKELPKQPTDKKTKEAPKEEPKDVKKDLTAEEKALASHEDDKKPVKGKSPLDFFLKEDDKGNLVHPDGTVVAAAGKSREHFEAVKKAGREIRERATQLALSNVKGAEVLKQLVKQNEELQAAAKDRPNYASEANMSESEFSEAVGFVTSWKSDPIGTIKRLLTSAKANGIDLSSIGANITADPKDLRSMMEQIVREQISPMSKTLESSEAERRTQQELGSFYGSFPDAEEYHGVIEQAKQSHPDMSRERIWLELQLYLTKNPVKDEPQSTQQQSEQPKAEEPPAQQQANQEPPVKRFLKEPMTRDSSSMSFEDIAASVKKDYASGN